MSEVSTKTAETSAAKISIPDEDDTIRLIREFLDSGNEELLQGLFNCAGSDDDGENDPKPLTGVCRGPYDFSIFVPGKVFETLSISELEGSIKSKKDALRIIAYLVSWYNAATVECLRRISQCAVLDAKLGEAESRIKILEEQLGRLNEILFGKTSERRSSLDSGCHDSTEGKENKTFADPDQQQGTGDDRETPQADSQTEHSAGVDTPPETESAPDAERTAPETPASSDAQEPSAQEPSENQDGGNSDEVSGKTKEPTGKKGPKRKKGCGKKTAKNAIHLVMKRSLTDEQKAELVKNGGKIKYLPDRKYKELRYLQVILEVEYQCESAMNTETGEIITAGSAQDKLRAGSELSTDLLARIVYLRTCLGMSGTRILKDFNTFGLDLDKQNLYLWYFQYSFALIRPLVERMLQKIFEAGRAQTDETWTKIREELHKKNRQNSVLWLLRTSEKLNIPPIVVLSFTGTRAAKAFADIIRGHALKLMSDGYSGYGALLKEFADQIELTSCLQHGRSRFVDIIQALKGKKEYNKMPEEARKKLPVNQILDLFGAVFDAENRMDPEWNLEKKKRYRTETVLPLLDALFNKIDERYGQLTKSDVGYERQALEYMRKYRERFYEAAKDPQMPLTNSACERCFAQYGVIRNNYHQLDSVLGAEAMCMWFSVCQTARENKVDEQIYLSYLIEKLPAVLKEHGDYYFMSKEEIRKRRDSNTLPTYHDLASLDQFMPWEEDFKNYEKEFQKRMEENIRFLAKLFESNPGAIRVILDSEMSGAA